jgi:hypothetical protein
VKNLLNMNEPCMNKSSPSSQERILRKHFYHKKSVRNNMTMMNIKRSLLLIALILGVTAASMTGQSFFTPDDRIVNGFVRKLSGTDFEYHSCIPGLRESIPVSYTHLTLPTTPYV